VIHFRLFGASLCTHVTEQSPSTANVIFVPSFFGEAPLLAAVRTGQRPAREAFYRRHVAEVERLLLCLLGPEEPVAPHVEQIFSSALTALRSYMGKPEQLRIWLMRRVLQRCRQVHRRRRLRSMWSSLGADGTSRSGRKQSGRVTAGSVPRRGSGPKSDRSSPFGAPRQVASGEVLAVRELQPQGLPLSECYAVLNRVPLQLGTALCLYWIAEMPVDEIAQLCDLTEATVRQRIARGYEMFIDLAWADPELRCWLNPR